MPPRTKITRKVSADNTKPGRLLSSEDKQNSEEIMDENSNSGSKLKPISSFTNKLAERTKEYRWINVFHCRAGARIRDIRDSGVRQLKAGLINSYIPFNPVIVMEDSTETFNAA